MLPHTLCACMHSLYSSWHKFLQFVNWHFCAPRCHFVPRDWSSAIKKLNAEFISGSVGDAGGSSERTHLVNALQKWENQSWEDDIALALSLSNSFYFCPNLPLSFLFCLTNISQLKRTSYPPDLTQPSNVKTHHLFFFPRPLILSRAPLFLSLISIVSDAAFVTAISECNERWWRARARFIYLDRE